MLDQHAKEALQAAQQGAVDHVRPVLLPVLADVGEVKAVGVVEVELDGGELPLRPMASLDLQVDLWAIESAAAFIHFVVQTRNASSDSRRAASAATQRSGFAHRIFRAGAQVGFDFLEAKRAQDMQAEIRAQNRSQPASGRAAEVVGIILGEAAHAQQPVQHAAAFIAVDRAHFGIADGQLAVGAHVAFIDVHMEGAVHRFEDNIAALRCRSGNTCSLGNNPGVRWFPTGRLCRCGGYRRNHSQPSHAPRARNPP